MTKEKALGLMGLGAVFVGLWVWFLVVAFGIPVPHDEINNQNYVIWQQLAAFLLPVEVAIPSGLAWLARWWFKNIWPDLPSEASVRKQKRETRLYRARQEVAQLERELGM